MPKKLVISLVILLIILNIQIRDKEESIYIVESDGEIELHKNNGEIRY